MSLGISRHSMGFYKSKSLLRARTHGKTCYSDQGFDLTELNFGNHAITKDIGLLFQHRATQKNRHSDLKQSGFNCNRLATSCLAGESKPNWFFRISGKIQPGHHQITLECARMIQSAVAVDLCHDPIHISLFHF